jgi:uncharacterized LabA/DUF88 family protein
MARDFHWSIDAVPNFRRLMIFIDGENLVMRYQDMVKKGWEARTDEVLYIPDSVIWQSTFSQGIAMNEVLRATYYTYVIGDSDKVTRVENAIKNLQFNKHRNSTLPSQITPQVFKKENRSAKGKGVDIALVVDMLSHVHADNIDAVMLLSGDGDYAPLIREVQRCGKQCYVSAFSLGLNPRLPIIADSFNSLDSSMFVSGPKGPV